jgi:rfaE bifunctional protein nucleotidyltransferase chain/domain
MASMDPTALIVGASAVLVADYGRGVASLTGVREALARRGAAARVVWDPHPHGPHPVEGTHLTPNESEASALLRSAGLRTSTEPADLAQALCRRFACASVALTRGAAGSLYTTGDGPPLSLPPERPVSGDCCGAGDAFAAALTAALAGGLLPREAAQHAVTEAGRYVAAGGPANWSPTAAHRARRSDPAVMSGRMRSPLGGGAVVVATSGCFDLLHAGHVEMLRAARDLGDRLVVLLNSDASVRRLKGHGRPVQSAVDRARILASLRSVDDVWIFDEDDPVASLRKLRPDIFVKGGDYAYHDLVEARAVGEWGGTVRILPYSDGRSTTSIIEHARATGFAT